MSLRLKLRVLPVAACAALIAGCSRTSSTTAFVPGTVLGPLTVSSASVSFPITLTGSVSATQNVVLSNAGSEAMGILGIDLAGADRGDFSQTNYCPSGLQGGTSCTISLTFAPQATGSRTATLEVNGQTIKVNLIGTGVAPGPVTVSPSNLNYDIAETLQDVTLSNYGNSPLTINSITEADIGGINADFQIVENNCGTSLPAQSVCTVSVTSFVAGTMGNEEDLQSATGTLTFDDDAPISPQTVALSSTNADSFSVGGSTGLGNFVGVIAFPANQVGYQQTASPLISAPASFYLPGANSAVVLSGADAGDFGISFFQTPNFGNAPPDQCDGEMLVNGGECIYTFTFTPTAAGARSAKAYVTGVASGEYILLAGTGLGPGPSFSASLSNSNLYLALPSADPNSATYAFATLTVTNTGTTTFRLAGSVSGPNASLISVNEGNCTAVAPQATCTATVSFNAASVGTYTATLNLADANSAAAAVSLPISAVAQYWPVTVKPNALSFPNQLPGTTGVAQTFVLSDYYGYPLGHALTVKLPSPSNFTLTQGSSCAASLAQTCTLAVAFSPSHVGVINERATVTDATSGSIAYLNLTGTAGLPAVTLSTTTVTFPTRSNGTTSVPYAITLTNTGVEPLTVSSIAIQYADDGNFTETDNCLAGVAVNASCTINVTFAPKSVGNQHASLQIVSNAPSSPDIISLWGESD